MFALDPRFDSETGRARLVEKPTPSFAADEVLIEIAVSALNRADLLQLRGHYPAPAGESEVPGLECAGAIVAVGAGVRGWEVGQQVMALLAGGGHAQMVAAPAAQLMEVPVGWSLEQAGAFPEVALTAWTNLVVEGELIELEDVLITAAASGVGTMAVAMAHELGAASIVVAGRDPERLSRLEPLGATLALELGPDLPARLRSANGGRGVHLVLDLVGGPGLAASLGCLRSRGRLVLVGLLGGTEGVVPLDQVLSRRLRLIGSVLRSRSRLEKAALIAGFRDRFEMELAAGKLQPILDRVVPASSIADAVESMVRGGHLGKIAIDWREVNLASS